MFERPTVRNIGPDRNLFLFQEKTGPGRLSHRGRLPSDLARLASARPDLPYAPTFALIQAVVWDFGRVMGSHQARLMMSWERRPIARETLKNTV